MDVIPVTHDTKITFWVSSEIQRDVLEPYVLAERELKEAINKCLCRSSYGEGLKEWAYLAVILNSETDPYYPEVKRCSRKKKEVEFRLKIDHEKFLKGDARTHLKLLAESVLRSLDLMRQMKIKDLDLDRLTKDVTQCLSKYLK